MSGKSKKVKGTKQTLEYVETEFKLHVPKIKCKNERQKALIRTMQEKEVVFCAAQAGVGKTYCILWEALHQMAQDSSKQLILVKSVQQLPFEELGFNQGSFAEKVMPFQESFIANIDKIVGEDQRKILVAQKRIRFLPLSIARGITCDNCIMFVDEAQNLSMHTFKTIITRLGENSRLVLAGDPAQSDFKDSANSVFLKMTEIFEDDEKVGVVKFLPGDCVRNPLIEYMLNKIDKSL